MDDQLTEVPTPVGTARLHGEIRSAATGLVLLGHGAGGGVLAPDLQAVAGAARAAGWAAVLVEQPYRVLSARRPPPPAAHLDAAWAAVLDALGWSGPVVVGGRSSGARVACRTAAGRAAGVVALAFPLRPPRGTADRTEELAGVGVPLLVVQGARDPFGSPEDVRAAAPGARVHAVAGADHSFAARRLDGRTSAECVAEVAGAVAGFLGSLSGPAEPSTPR